MRSAFTLALLLVACDDRAPAPEPWAWALPVGFPEPHVPVNNPMSAAKVELGRHLFYDERLSHNETMACASCHEQARAFTDGKATGEGSSTGHVLPRSADEPRQRRLLVDLHLGQPQARGSGDAGAGAPVRRLPARARRPAGHAAILRRFAATPDYQALFAAAFPDDDDPFTITRIVQAISSFERTIISGDAPYDRFVYALDDDALSPAAQRGMALFFGERAECYHCHAGPNFSTSFRSATSEAGPPDFQNNGLYNLDPAGAYPPGNGGLFEFTGDPRDQGKFRVPSLRNIAVTAPYMHDGSLATLADVVDHYAAGGTVTPAGPNAGGDGRNNPNKSPLVRPFDLAADERADLVAFLESLTDEQFLSDPRFAAP
jgi:cytochrome c peroxidase